MKMIHWDTLQENESECTTDHGETRMVREDDAVFLHVRSDLLAGPELLEDVAYIDEVADLSLAELSKLDEGEHVEIAVTAGALVDIKRHLAAARGEGQTGDPVASDPANVTDLVDEYDNIATEFDGIECPDEERVAKMLHDDHAWTDDGARKLVGLAMKYGVDILRNALALAIALKIEDGSEGM